MRITLGFLALVGLAGCEPSRKVLLDEDRSIDILRLADRLDDVYDVRALKAMYGEPFLVAENLLGYRSLYRGLWDEREYWYLLITVEAGSERISSELYLELFEKDVPPVARASRADIVNYAKRVQFGEMEPYRAWLKRPYDFWFDVK